MNQVIAWVSAHPAEIAAAWGAITAIINAALRFKDTSEWVSFAANNPKTAGLIRFIRAVGVDPVKAANAIVTALNAKDAKK